MKCKVCLEEKCPFTFPDTVYECFMEEESRFWSKSWKLIGH